MSTICDDLRAAILQAAMQGKLVKQLPEDGDAKDLLKRITTKRTTKNKAAQTITEHDQLFDIPDNWQWIRIGDIFETITGGTPSKTHPEYYGGDYPFFKPSDLGINKYTESASEYLTESGKNISRQLPKNTILVCCIGSIGKTSIMSCEGTTNQQINAILPNDEINVEYIYYAIKSPVFYDTIWSLASSTTISIVNKSKMDSIMLPIPPLAEQKRIVEKIDELMARVADLEQSADALASLKKAFPDDIKASLLQAAMQGKLTKQLPEDGSAEDLLEEIKAEKEKLISEGKIKKQKPLASITDDEIPYSIPENWKWVRLNDIVVKEIRRGKPPVYDKNGSSFAFAQKCNTKYTGIDLSLAKAISNNSLKKYSEDDAIATSDIIVNSTGTGTLGRVGFIDPKIPMNTNYYPDSHVTIVRVPKFISNYVYAILKNNEKYFEEKGEGSTNQKELKPLTIQNLIIPLPPIAEQKRIVGRLNSILQNVNAVGDLIASE